MAARGRQQAFLCRQISRVSSVSSVSSVLVLLQFPRVAGTKNRAAEMGGPIRGRQGLEFSYGTMKSARCSVGKLVLLSVAMAV